MSRKSSNQPSIGDVAKLAGVSLGTVSNVLNHPHLVKTSTIESVRGAITKLGFVRNDAARQLKTGNSRAIGLIVLDSSNPFFAQLAKGVEDSASASDYQVLTGNSGHDKSRELGYLQMFLEQRLSGILLSPVEDASPSVSQIRELGTQVIVVDQKASPDTCCSVSVDDRAGGKLAMQHLVDLGRRNLAFLGGSLEIPQVADRLSGAREVVAASQGPIQLTTYVAGGQDVLSGRKVGEQILALPREERPDGIFAANDLLAVGLLQAFAISSDVSIPGEIAIIGYDDIDFAQSAVVPLSSIKQPAALIGSTAIELLEEEINNPDGHKHKQVVFQPTLVVRASSAG